MGWISVLISAFSMYCLPNGQKGCTDLHWLHYFLLLLFQTSRSWFNPFTSRGSSGSYGVTNPGANFDDPPDYDSLHPQQPTPTIETPPAYNEVIKDTVKYKVNDNTHDVICYV